MIFNKDTAEKTAELLLQINAIKLNPRNPFTWASGWNSPIYCDNRITLSFPAVRNYIRDEFSKNIEKQFGKPDVIAGVATGAIGIGILVAESLGLPFVLIRKKGKLPYNKISYSYDLEYGSATIEVHTDAITAEDHVLIHDDLLATGGSASAAAELVLQCGGKVAGFNFLVGLTFLNGNEKLEKYTNNIVNLARY